MHTTTLKIGTNRNAPRIYLQGKYLIDSGFRPGANCSIEFEREKIVIRPSLDGRKISGKKDGTIGVIDIAGQQIAQSFDGYNRVKVQAGDNEIVITPSRIAENVRRRALVATLVSLFAGGGLLDCAAAKAGFQPVAAIEYEERYADIWKANHPGDMFNVSIEEVSHEELSQYRDVGLMCMGIPCEPFSAIRRVSADGKAKRQTDGWSDHELADMFHWSLRAIDACNPHTVLIENVPGFLTSSAYEVMVHVLTRLGYRTIEGRIIDPYEYGAITGRKRTILIATMASEICWPLPWKTSLKTGNFLLHPSTPGLEWFTRDTPSKQWLFDHWAKNDAKGNGFTPPIIYGNEDKFPTIKKRYWAGQGDNFVIGHPSEKDKYRWLTIEEGKRIMGLPADYHLGYVKTTAGEILGQGVEVGTLFQIIASVTGIKIESGTIAA